MRQDFDIACSDMGIKVFMADASVDGPCVKIDNSEFIKKFIGAFNSEIFITMDNWIKNSNISEDKDLILQMDIEGYEYETIYSISNELMNRFRFIIIEFHALDMLFNSTYFERFKNVFNKLLETHYIVHIHPNNCCDIVKYKDIEIPPVMEFTFVKKERFKKIDFVIKYPHQLDVDCTTKKPTMILPECWYSIDK